MPLGCSEYPPRVSFSSKGGLCRLVHVFNPGAWSTFSLFFFGPWCMVMAVCHPSQFHGLGTGARGCGSTVRSMQTLHPGMMIDEGARNVKFALPKGPHPIATQVINNSQTFRTKETMGWKNQSRRTKAFPTIAAELGEWPYGALTTMPEAPAFRNLGD
jgi:hypothetical protein